MKKVLFLALAAASFSFASCESKKEEAADKQADAVEAKSDAQAADLKAKADSVEKAGDKTSDAMKSDSAKAKM